MFDCNTYKDKRHLRISVAITLLSKYLQFCNSHCFQDKCVFAFYAEFQDGHRKWREKDFWQTGADDSVHHVGQNFIEIALFCTISEINAFLPFYAEIQDGRQKWQENNFWETVVDNSVYTLGVKNFVQITVSHTVYKINTFLRFKQKFNMASKVVGNPFLAKSCR